MKVMAQKEDVCMHSVLGKWKVEALLFRIVFHCEQRWKVVGGTPKQKAEGKEVGPSLCFLI